MIKFLKILGLICVIASCSNSSDLNPEKIIFTALQDAVRRSESKIVRLDARKIVTREKIDKSGMDVLFVELENGYNGTLVGYPGNNEGTVWLGIDGATVTLDKGFLIATRGMGDDLMSTDAKFPDWDGLKKSFNYQRTYRWLTKDNQIKETSYICVISLEKTGKRIIVFEKKFLTDWYQETCDANSSQISNSYYLDYNGTVRRSYQYHSKHLKQVLIERLDTN